MENLCNPRVVKEILKKFDFRFAKDLGQNFLVDGEVPQNIAKSCELNENTGVIEIGPGFGVLTNELCKGAKKVVALEIDKRLPEILSYTLAEHNNLTVINKDVLKVDLAELIRTEFEGLDVIVCANLPYYITTPIIMALLEQKLDIKSVTVMVQKEVAQRLCAPPGSKDGGAISLAVSYYTEPKILFQVKKECFMPSPKVDSTVICLKVREKPPVDVVDEAQMFAFIKGAYLQRRKTLINSLLSSHLKYTKEELLECFSAVGIVEGIRGERLNLEDFAKISNYFSTHHKNV